MTHQASASKERTNGMLIDSVVLAFFIALTVAAGNIAGGAQPRGVAAKATIVFASARNGTSDIYVMNDDGTGVRQLTSTPAGESSPVWSPDAMQIAFLSRIDSFSPNEAPYFSADICVMEADGTNRRKLTPEIAGMPSPPS